MSVSSESDEYRELFQLFKTGLSQSVAQWFTEANLSQGDTLSVIENLLREIGEAWFYGEIPLTTIYVTARMSEEITSKLLFTSGEGIVPL